MAFTNENRLEQYRQSLPIIKQQIEAMEADREKLKEVESIAVKYGGKYALETIFKELETELRRAKQDKAQLKYYVK